MTLPPMQTFDSLRDMHSHALSWNDDSSHPYRAVSCREQIDNAKCFIAYEWGFECKAMVPPNPDLILATYLYIGWTTDHVWMLSEKNQLLPLKFPPLPTTPKILGARTQPGTPPTPSPELTWAAR